MGSKRADVTQQLNNSKGIEQTPTVDAGINGRRVRREALSQIAEFHKTYTVSGRVPDASPQR